MVGAVAEVRGAQRRSCLSCGGRLKGEAAPLPRQGSVAVVAGGIAEVRQDLVGAVGR